MECVDDPGWRWRGLDCAGFVGPDGPGVASCEAAWARGRAGDGSEQTPYDACAVACGNAEACADTPRQFFSVTTWERGQVVRDGITYDDWAPEYVGEAFAATVDSSEDDSTFYLSLDAVDESNVAFYEPDWADWMDDVEEPEVPESMMPQTFQRPRIQTSNPAVCNPSMSGPAASGGIVSYDSAEAQLDVQYHCLREGRATVTVTIPVGIYRDIVFAWTKLCEVEAEVMVAAPSVSADADADAEGEGDSGSGGGGGATVVVVIGIILGCVLCPIVVKQVKVGRAKLATKAGDSSAGPGSTSRQFSRLDVETLPLTHTHTHQGHGGGGGGSSSPAEATEAERSARLAYLAAEKAKVTALLAKHHLQAYEASLIELGASSPIHLAHLRWDDLQMFNLNEQDRRSFKSLLREVAAASAPVVQQAGPPSNSGAPDGYVAFQTPEPSRRVAAVVPEARVTPLPMPSLPARARPAATLPTPSSHSPRSPSSAEEWQTKEDPVSGKLFYFNLKTNERSFALPQALATLQVQTEQQEAAVATVDGVAPQARTVAAVAAPFFGGLQDASPSGAMVDSSEREGGLQHSDPFGEDQPLAVAPAPAAAPAAAAAAEGAARGEEVAADPDARDASASPAPPAKLWS